MLSNIGFKGLLFQTCIHLFPLQSLHPNVALRTVCEGLNESPMLQVPVVATQLCAASDTTALTNGAFAVYFKKHILV